VHAHGYVAGVVAAWALRGLRPRPHLVLTAHIVPDPLTGPRRAGFVRAWGYRWLLRQVDAGIAVSRAVRDALLAHDPTSESRWRVVYNGIDPRPFQRRVDPGAKRRELGVDPAAAVVGAVARLSEEKGVDIFLRAAALVSREIPNVDFVVVGDGSAREELEQLAHVLHLTGQVLFLGQRRDVPQILAALDILIVPSREESFGLAALEGIAAGVPIIASDVAGLREVLGATSLVEFVPPEDPEPLADAIKRELTKVSYDGTQAHEIALPGGGISSLADMLVSQTEFDLDATGLERRQQASAASRATEREAVLDRFDIRRMVHATIGVYDDLLRESA
jgi:glycosyltransferase involved in cell wall biosynthesis